jgi:hypothetical protein
MMHNFIKMKKMKRFLPVFIVLFLMGCSDSATVVHYDKSLTHLPCLRLVVFPPDRLLSQTLTELYDFKRDCAYELQVSRKSGIACNSNQNADKKALSNFPSGFLRLDIYKNHKPIYSYYKDLNCAVKKEDIQRGFSRLKNDFHLK